MKTFEDFINNQPEGYFNIRLPKWCKYRYIREFSPLWYIVKVVQTISIVALGWAFLVTSIALAMVWAGV